MTTSAARQQWLDQCHDALRQHFAQHGHDLPQAVRVTWGFPAKRATGKAKAIGVCFDKTATEDQHAEVFIHPIHAKAPADIELGIAATMAHELAHAHLGTAIGHKKPFANLVTQIGLEGKPTSTHAGEAFKQALAPKLALIGPFPTTGLDPSDAPGKKQSTRMLKCECPECGYLCRASRKVLTAHGAPICPSCAPTQMRWEGDDPDGEEGDE